MDARHAMGNPSPGSSRSQMQSTTARRCMMGSVQTPLTNFRIPADIKQAAQEKAEREGKTLSRVVIDLLREYARG